MNKACLSISLVLLFFSAFASGSTSGISQDTGEVIRLNKLGFEIRMTNPDQAVAYGAKALILAKKLDYKNGIGEAYRVMGIGHYYMSESVKAIDEYLMALNYFQQTKDLRAQGKVYNNIGNLYRDNDAGLSLEFYNRALVIGKKLGDTQIVANIYLNVGNVYFRKKSFYQALGYYDKSNTLFVNLKDTVNLIQCLQNKGVIYHYLHQYKKAEVFLLAAVKAAKQLDLNITIASIDLATAELYMSQNKFAEAESTLQEGLTYAQIVKDDKLQADFKYTSYQLEFKKKNYQGALFLLRDIYKQDSLVYKQNTSTQITLIREEVKQQARQKENEILLQRQQNDRVKFWAVLLVAGLLLVLVAVLVGNVKRKSKTNLQLTNLNAEVSRQKDNLDRINHHLEEIIDERTKDLQIKNKKLSEYSSYLSHQIRGPIATLKGLMNLEKEGLVDQPECIRMMNKCVGEIDDKIIEMSDMLHDPGRTGF